MGQTGTVKPSRVAQTAILDGSAASIFKRGNATGYATISYRRNRFRLLGDLSGFHSTDAAHAGMGESAVVVQHLTALTLTPGYAIVDEPRASIAAFGGVRIWRMSNSVSVPSLDIHDKARTSYYDVVFAAHAERSLGNVMKAAFYADAGGFHIASDLTWQFAARLDVRASEQWSLHTGFRRLAVDYRGDNKQISLSLSGPYLGAALHF